MAKSNRDRVGEALDHFVDGFRPFVLERLEQRHGADKAEEKGREYLEQNAKQGQHIPMSSKEWDAAALVNIITSDWQYLFRNHLSATDRSMLHELREVRNQWAHQKTFSTDDTIRALDTTERLLISIAALAQAGEVAKIKGEVMRTRFAEMQRTATERAKRQPTEGTPRAGLRPWRDVVAPHPDVQTGTLAVAEFAADLAQVHRGGAAAEYQEPKEFFRRTFLTEGLRGLLVNAIKRFAGQGGHPVIDLQTNFGGGKTHSMLALYHLCSNVRAADLPGVDTLILDAGGKEPKDVQRAVLVGSALTAGDLGSTRDGVEPHTLWGLMAAQLGGKAGYEIVKKADTSAIAPGSDLLVKLFRSIGKPCLILIDEWVAYCRQLWERPHVTGGSFDSNLSFAHSLTEAVKACPNVLLVASLPQSQIEVGGTAGQQALAVLQNTFARLEFNWRPATQEESYEIVRRRLFEPILDPNLFADRDAVVGAFGQMYRQGKEEFPFDANETAYMRRMESAYPIHPELFDRLYNDWSSLEEFQRTRGVLRLMAAVIHTLWVRNDRSLLIMPGLLPIDEPTLQGELTRYLAPNWPVIIDQEVDGPNALSTNIDKTTQRYGQVWAARRVARTIYLGSAPEPGLAHRGLEMKRIRLGCTQPGENVAVFGDALRQLGEQASYLYTDGARHWFSTQPNVTNTARDRAAQVEEDNAFDEIETRIRKTEKERGGFAKVKACPLGHSDVSDDLDTQLVILRPSQPHVHGSKTSKAIQTAQEFLDKRGSSPRFNKNAIVFLAADAASIEDLKNAASQFIGWNSICEEKKALSLDPFNVSLAERKRDEFSRSLDLRIVQTFQWVLAPHQPKANGDIEWDVSRASSGDKLSERAFQKLKRSGQLDDAFSGPALAKALKDFLWRGSDHVAVSQLMEDFPRFLYLHRLTTPELLVDAIRDGLASVVWSSETFAYASAFDDESKRYVHLRAGVTGVLIETTGKSLIVKPAVAAKQIEEDARAANTIRSPTGPGSDSSTGATLPPPTTIRSNDPPPPKPEPLTRFYGNVALNPLKVASDVGEVVKEIVQHLTSKLGCKVKVTLNIDAEFPAGFDEATVRTVRENANAMKFLNHEFEKH